MRHLFTRLTCWWHGHQWRHEDEDVYCNRIRCARCAELFSEGRRWDSFPFDVFAASKSAPSQKET